MPNFTDETRVRLRFQLHDAVLVAAELVERAIADAHTEILRALDDDVDLDLPDDAMVMGETLLAGAHLFRALASGEAFKPRGVALGGHRLENSERFAALMGIADLSERQAWYILEPYIRAAPPRTPLQSSDSLPVLGEE